MRILYTQPTTFSAEGLTIGGTIDGVVEFNEADPVVRAQLKAFLAHPSVKHRMKIGQIVKLTDNQGSDEGVVFTLDDGPSTDEETESNEETNEESEDDESEEEAAPAKPARATRRRS